MNPIPPPIDPAPLTNASAGVTVHNPGGLSATSHGPETITELISARARELGFVAVGVSGVARFEHAAEALERWRERGFAGEMSYLLNPKERADVAALLPGVRSVVVVAWPYPIQIAPSAKDSQEDGARDSPLVGSVAQYAQGEDYHSLIKRKLRQLADDCANWVGRTVRARACVDTAPLLEREAASRAGLGFIGKNTLMILPRIGSGVVLGELLLDVAVTPSEQPSANAHCGRCTACLSACPSQAFPEPFVLDARRCVAYLTIELSGPIPRDLRSKVGTRVFGCDVCQQVCPHNRGPANRQSATSAFSQGTVDLVAVLEQRSGDYRRLVRGTALTRASRDRLARNAVVALGNTGDSRAIPPLCRALASHPNWVVRSHAAWALGRLGGPIAQLALEGALLDADAHVQEEAQLALQELKVH